MPFNDMQVQGEVTAIGYQTPEYCTIYWLVDGERKARTVCYSPEEMVYNINNRSRFTDNLRFEIEYGQQVQSQAFKNVV